MKLPDALLLEPSDFVAYPVGGQTSFCRQMMSAFGDRLGLVGFSTDDETPVGRWSRKIFAGVTYHFFSIARVVPQATKPRVPLRVTSYLQIQQHRRGILSLGVRNTFTQAPEAMLAMHRWEWQSQCFVFPGIHNILNMSRYVWARPLAKSYELQIAKALQHVQVILAAADAEEIAAFVQRTHGILPAERITSFPTRVDTEVFRPRNKAAVRGALRVPVDAPLIVSCARLSRRKGWDLVLEAFALLFKQQPQARLVYIGDGEDRVPLQQSIAAAGLDHAVTLLGFQPPDVVAQWDAACDVFANGSHFEGWPVAQLEAIACGAALVSTNVSGARSLIINGENGFLVQGRSPHVFCDAILQALGLQNATAVSLRVAEDYAVRNLAPALGKLWPPLAAPVTDEVLEAAR